ncbi:MAG: aspartate kinase [Chthoniobacterales bacterium]
MPLIVQKYGGTSVANPERIKAVAQRLLETQQQGNSVVGVVSAMSGVTDSLLRLAKEVALTPARRELDMLLATGEQTTMALTAMAIEALGGKAVSMTGAQAGIVTDDFYTKAKIDQIIPEQIQEHLNQGAIVIVAGFQGETRQGDITTLGRGGSDLTAIALASALHADECHILTDVDGVFTCDPRIVPKAKKIEVIAYEEMLEMASSGSKVMQSRSVEFAKKFNVPFEVRSSFKNTSGTIVQEESPGMEQVVVRGISVEGNQAKVTITNVPDHPGCAARIFTAVAEAQLVIDVIVQDVSAHGTTNISFTLNNEELDKMGDLLERIAAEIGAGEVRKESGIAKLSVVGIGMRTHSGVAAKLFECLAQGGINIQMISTSEIKIAVIIEEESIRKAAQLTHTAFGLDKL